MKYINWGIINGDDAEQKNIEELFNSVNGSKVVVCDNENNALSIINSNKINAIYINTKPELHATYAIMAMNAGIPVFLNYPLANTYDDCIRINYTADKTKIPCFVSYYLRYLPYYKTIKNILNDEIIGDILQVNFCFYSTAEHQLFLNYASQQLDILQYLFGIIIEATGFSSQQSNSYDYDRKTINACLMFEKGISGSSSWCFGVPECEEKDIVEVIGSKGSLRFSTFSHKHIQINQNGNLKDYNDKEIQTPQLPIIKAVVEDLQGFNVCKCTSVSATPVNWVLDRILRHV